MHSWSVGRSCQARSSTGLTSALPDLCMLQAGSGVHRSPSRSLKAPAWKAGQHTTPEAGSAVPDKPACP